MATLATNISFQCLGLDGKPLAGGKVYTYEAGTTTPKTTYTTRQGNVPNANPVILDQNGKAKIYLGDGSYRFRILDSNDALVDDTNDISRYVTQSEFAVFQQIINEGISQLTEVREQIDVYVTTAIGNQKGFANGVAPLDTNVKIPHVYLPQIVNNTTTNDPNKLLSAAAGLDLQQQITNAYNQQFGLGQLYQDVTGSRVANTTYTNSTARPIFVYAELKSTSGDVVSLEAYALVNGVVASRDSSYSASLNYKLGLNFVVPPGGSYSIVPVSNVSLIYCSELRQ